MFSDCLGLLREAIAQLVLAATKSLSRAEAKQAMRRFWVATAKPRRPKLDRFRLWGERLGSCLNHIRSVTERRPFQ